MNDYGSGEESSISYDASSQCSDDSPYSYDNSPNDTFKEELAKWLCVADGMGLTREHANNLLRLLKTHCLPDFPIDSRTLTKRPRQIDSVGGEFVHFGIENTLSALNGRLDNNILELKVGIDGIPVHKDGKHMHMWPILISTEEIPPVVVALWYGASKPGSVSDYLREFLEELTRLTRTGITINQRQFEIKLKCFICDAPARAFIKQIKGHNARQSCERCDIIGTEVDNTMCYISHGDEVMRTDDGYVNDAYIPDHQTRGKTSPLVDYDIGLVSKFPLDYMHLVCLGVMRRFLKFLTKANTEYRISNAQFTQIGDRLSSFATMMPSEFARRPRNLVYIDCFKATEFRQFLLYTGIVALKSIVPTDIYQTYLCLNIACSILLNDDNDARNQHLEFAKDLLQSLVQNCGNMFGSSFVSYNVHSLLHIVDDSSTFGCALNNLSAFEFESYLCKIKRRVKHCNNVLSQVAKSILAERKLNGIKITKRAQNHRLILSADDKDCYFFDQLHRLCVIKEVSDDGSQYKCNIIDQQRLLDFFDVPCPSSYMLIYYIEKRTSHNEVILSVKDVYRKVILLKVEKGGYVAVPMLHEGYVNN